MREYIWNAGRCALAPFADLRAVVTVCARPHPYPLCAPELDFPKAPHRCYTAQLILELISESLAGRSECRIFVQRWRPQAVPQEGYFWTKRRPQTPRWGASLHYKRTCCPTTAMLIY